MVGVDVERELMKLKEDLETVMDRVRLCREMLPNSPGIREDEALAEVVGFLEACKPRMVRTVEQQQQQQTFLWWSWR